MKLLLCILLLLPMYAIAENPHSNLSVSTEDPTAIVTVLDNPDKLESGVPITGIVTVTHYSSDRVDINSFSISGEPLKVSFIKTIKFSDYSKVEVSVYDFETSGWSAGSHVFPSIKVQVGKNEYESNPILIEVDE